MTYTREQYLEMADRLIEAHLAVEDNRCLDAAAMLLAAADAQARFELRLHERQLMSTAYLGTTSLCAKPASTARHIGS